MFDLAKVPFARRGAYLSILNRQDGLNEDRGLNDMLRGTVDELYLSRTWNNTCGLKRADLIQIVLLADGKEISYEYTASPAVLRLDAAGGFVEFVITKDNIFRFRGCGVTLRLEAVPGGHEGSVEKPNNTWEIAFSNIGKFLFVPVKGRMHAEGGLNWMYQQPYPVTVDYCADETGGSFEGAVHYYAQSGHPKAAYEPFDEIRQEAEADFEAWKEKYPAVPEEFRATRELALYEIWSHILPPGGLIKNEVVYMSRNCLADAFGWQQSYQAVAVSRDIHQAWAFLCNMFDYQRENGQLPDWLNDCCDNDLTCKPPFQGVAFAWLFEHARMEELTEKEYHRLYEPLAKWALWWFNERDDDHNGIPQYNHPDESGWDDSSIFSKGVPVESPDLAAYLVLITEALSKIAAALSRDADAVFWKLRSETLLESMIRELWDGRHFFARKAVTFERIESRCVAMVQPIVLGKRLPKEIRDILAEDICGPGGFLAEFGVMSEHPDSDLLELRNGFCRGSVVSPVQMMMALGLLSAGEKDKAKEIARRFCRKVQRDGFSLEHFPYDAPELVVAPSEKAKNFVADMTLDTSWTAAVFLVLAGFVLKEDCRKG